MTKIKIAVIGGGAAALAFACFIDSEQFDVTIYEKNKAVGRKFLVAGKGGFNLTHSEAAEQLIKKYRPSGFLDSCLLAFSNVDFRKWLEEIGINTFIGTSKRVFPLKGTKPIQVLDAILNHIQAKNISIKTRYEWQGEKIGDIMIYALGGGSWSVTGSDGSWTKFFDSTVPFAPSNCAYEVNWPSSFLEVNEGKPLKNIILTCNKIQSKGELVITKFGLEGGAIYALSGEINGLLEQNGEARIHIDLKKDLTARDIQIKLLKSKESNISKALKRDLNLPKQVIQLIKNGLDKAAYTNIKLLADKIKNFPLDLICVAPIDEAISTTGGISTRDLDQNFQLISKPGHYCIGEMIDWDAPTGGYLLQACFSMGYYLATNLSSNRP